MDGVTPRHLREQFDDGTLAGGLMRWARSHRLWFLIVAIPTILVAIYYVFIASNQYESEAHISVHSVSPAAPISSSLTPILNIAGVGGDQMQTLTLSDFLRSHDAVEALRARGLIDMFRRPEADFLSRVRSDPTPETLLKYYSHQVDARIDTENGSLIVKVRAFRPADAYRIIHELLSLSELHVNQLNARSYKETLRASQRELQDAENDVSAIQRRMGSLRTSRGDIDPKGTGEAQLTLLTQLKQQLAIAQSQLAGMGATISRSSPQYVALDARVRGLAAQVASAESRLTQGTGSISSSLTSYEELKIRQDFAGKRYEAAAAAVEKSRDQALRQQLFIVRNVEPNMPVKSLFPHRWKTIFTTFLGLQLAYAIGWLIAAGMREHAA